MTKKQYKSIYLFCKLAKMSEKKQQAVQCIITPEMRKKLDEQEKMIKMVVNPKSETLVIRIDGWLWRVIAMSGAITEKAKQQKVKVIIILILSLIGK